MDREELLKEIKETEEHLANMKKMLEDCNYKRWKPKENETYYCVCACGNAVQGWYSPELDTSVQRYNFYNCFKTREEAEQEAEKILVRRQLEAIAKELNGDRQINWNDTYQDKYCIAYNAVQKQLYCNSNHCHQIAGVVYSLSPCFLEEAIKEIGEEQLKIYITGDI